MISTRRSAALLGGLFVLALLASAARAEDFSVHLSTMAELDTARPLLAIAPPPQSRREQAVAAAARPRMA